MNYLNKEGKCHYLNTKPTNLGVWFDKQKHLEYMCILKEHNVKRLLDIGPGRGYLCDLCEDIEYIGMDKEPEICELIREKGCVCHLRDVPPFYIDGLYDAIICCDVIEHMKSYEKAEQLIIEIYNHLNKGGIAIIHAPEMKYAKWDFWDVSYDHYFPTSRNRIEGLCLNVGLKIVYSGLWISCFKDRLAKLIWYATRFVPPFGKILRNIRKKHLCCVIIATKC